MTQDLRYSDAVACDNDLGDRNSDRTQRNNDLKTPADNSGKQMIETLENQSDLANTQDKCTNSVAVVAENQPAQTEDLETEPVLSREVFSTIEGFELIRDFWSGLNVDLMNSFAWNLWWWKSFQSLGDLHLLTFKQEGELVGIAPFYVDRWFGLKRFRFIASGKACTDYVDLICDPKHYERCASSLSEYIREQKFDVVELECPNEDHLVTSIGPTLESVYDFDHRDVEPTWLMELPSEWKEFLSSRRSSLRRKINKAVRRLEAGEFVITSTSEGVPMESALATLKDLHTRRMVSTGKPGVFADPQFEEFLNNVVMEKAAAGEIEIIVASTDDGPVGVQLYFDTSRGYQFYQSGYAPEAMKLEPGHLLFTEMVKRAIHRGDTRFDFLRGNEPYKEFWEAKPHGQKKLRMVSKRLIPRAIAKAIETSRRLVRGG